MSSSQHKQHLKDFIQELDEDRFYDAHESLEAIWFPRRFEESDEIKLLKGFINAAVCFELIKKGRAESAKKVWNTYLKYKPLVHKINSEHLSEYHFLILHVEKIKDKLDINQLGV
ncbi:MAG: DUF309 domain-containing protein [Sulfurimonas sp.]|uniref:DUF309 domain-containing protein n=1 Tax=Sulfurimonas sp. TaxID=2022749 RepID=UPI00262245C3|nr:DUF309 domain-containing protein [Sulfurimonas sp.]MCW8894578.1 DUF309 domain-containing protein [Sulfurimonas sp.]MCW8953783.1 DUF309 domain-containing protein [Sulfurimonas sp.]